MSAPTGPCIYNLFPLLAGPIEAAPDGGWTSWLAHIQAMNFDWLFINPFHFPGFSGSIYAIKDYRELHPRVRGDSRKPADELLRDFIIAAEAHGLKVMLDLVVNHTSKDALLVDEHPDWYRHNPDGTLYSPRAIDPDDPKKATVWGDLAELDYRSPEARAGLLGFWSEYIGHAIDLGVSGFRCDAAYQVDAEVWQELIGAARAKHATVVFAAETLGCTPKQAAELAPCGFDYFFNSAKWWDFQSPWLLDQYRKLRRIAPSIAFPESHDTPRLVVDLDSDDPDLIERHYRQRYLFAALFSSGVLLPMGYEYGFAKPLHVVDTRPEDAEHPRFDLSAFIAAVNAMKKGCAVLGREGPQQLLPTSDPLATALLRHAEHSRDSACVLTLVNTDATRTATVDSAALLAGIGRLPADFTEITPSGSPEALLTAPVLSLEPLAVRAFQTAPKIPKTTQAAMGHHRPDNTHVKENSMAIAPPQEVIDAIVNGVHNDPFAVLGLHEDGPDETVVVRAFLPTINSIEVIETESGKPIATLEQLHPNGFFAGAAGRRKKSFSYRLRISGDNGDSEIEDPYRFPPTLGELDSYLLGEGTHRRAYEQLGAHPIELEGVAGVVFRVWAPNARRVAVLGDFNGWDRRTHAMRLHHHTGIWEIFLPHVGIGAHYKFEITSGDDRRLPLKADPYAFAMERRPNTASIVTGLPRWEWADQDWLAVRAEKGMHAAPMSIYEVHLGSWKRKQPDNTYLSYRELAETLIPYVKDMGFTHIELMPINEHPFDGSWGYQPIGLFAPTSRFGSPEDFRYFIERCHQAGIGILLDWVPGHFPTDAHGLNSFDGTFLYEHADPRQGFQLDWQTLIYNFGRTEVANFLLNNALFWLDRYHLDGLRVDAVASMLYLDYSREEGGWIPNKYGGRENLDAVQLLRRMNELSYGEYPGVMTVAEESTSWPAVSQPVYLGGLGFGYKWNMGWMHDTLSYMSLDPVHRKFHHHKMTFGMLYAYSENFVLPLSHDEVVHGKRSLIGRMPGDAWQQFANLRAYYGFMWTHPGKKLLFMGGEFAQGREWNHDAGLDWHLLDIHWHAEVQRLVRDLNHLYRSLPALHQYDCNPSGFSWIEADNAEYSIYAYIRRGEHGTPPVVVVCNFTPVPRDGYRLGVPEAGFYAERLNTDADIYGGGNMGNRGGMHTQPLPSHGQEQSIIITAPPLATVIFELQRD